MRQRPIDDSRDETPGAASPRGRVILRWSLFLLTTILAIGTLVLLLRSDDEGWELKIRTSGPTASADEFRIVHVGWGYLGFGKEIGIRTTFVGPSGTLHFGRSSSSASSASHAPLFQMERAHPRLEILDWKWKIPLGGILAVECLSLFFLVPSVIGRARDR